MEVVRIFKEEIKKINGFLLLGCERGWVVAEVGTLIAKVNVG